VTVASLCVPDDDIKVISHALQGAPRALMPSSPFVSATDKVTFTPV